MGDATQQAASKSWVEVKFSPKPSYTLLFDGMRGHEELGRPFLYDLDLSSGELRAGIVELVGRSCTIWLSQSKEGTEDRYFIGIVTRVVAAGLIAGAYRYRLEIRPWFWLLTRQMDNRIFQKKSAFKIITELFSAEGLQYEDKRQASAGDTELEYCVQYHESTYDFIMRLMEEYGLYYYFKHSDGEHKLMISDDPNAHEALSDALPFVYEQTDYRTVGDHIWTWSTDLSLQSGKVTFRDYNFTTPSADLTAKTVKEESHEHGKYEVYEYPGPYDITATGNKLTDVRMQAIAMNRTVIDGESNARGLHPGWRFTLSKHPQTAVNKEYLVIKSDFVLGMGDGSTVDNESDNQSETIDTYRVAFVAIPGDVPFRLDRATPRPSIRGLQTAKVVGASGEEIDTDEYGRVKVKFHWDRAEVDDDQRTCWIRVAQMMAGNAWGTMFIPRVEQEVVVEFLEGNPDRPLITGVVYNANNKVPYALPDNKTRSTVKTNSSKGGGGFNEIRFEDKKDSEEVFFQAQKDYNKVVLNNETVKIKKDTTTTVEEGNRSVTVSKGNDEHTVSEGNQKVTVSKGDVTHSVDTGKRTTSINGNDATTVKTGDHTVDVSAGKGAVTAAQSITHTVGGNSAKIDTSSLTLTVGANSIKIDMMQIVITCGANSVKLDPSGITLTGAPLVQIN